MKNINWEKAVINFHTRKKVERRRPKTIKLYLDELRKFKAFMEKEGVE